MSPSHRGRAQSPRTRPFELVEDGRFRGTVQTPTIGVYDKLGVRTRAGAALRASELGILR
ncbi:hypothetical protein AKJ09_08912 [Labilithrix luteola]|uniref:Uncharacterized protein n=1 Tax=Labilithrix luteola TaxID=1391654 RepID=A0A0K1Q944_9BACT|nr:hypothetical protein AKJ09_08912 [Labilithrix luteola]